MGKVVKLTESDLVHIISRIIVEQKKLQIVGSQQSKPTSDYLGKGGGFERKAGISQKREQLSYEDMINKLPNLECLPNYNMRIFVLYIIGKKQELMKDLGIDEKTLVFLTKISMSLMWWQSNYGYVDKLRDIKPIAGFINPWDVYKTVDLVAKKTIGISAAKPTEWIAKTFKLDEPSFGPGEFMPSTFEKTGVEKKYGKGIESVIGAGLGIIYSTMANYREAQKNGLSNKPSQNNIAKNKGIPGWGNTMGTGNHLWNVAIAAHTYPEEKILIKYCTTNRPDFMGPCTKNKYKPFKDPSEWEKYKNNEGNKSFYQKNKQLDKFPGELSVNQGQPIDNYYPYLVGAHGQITDMDNSTIIRRINDHIITYGCIDEAFKKVPAVKIN